MSEEKQKNKISKILDSDFVKAIALISSLLSIVGVIWNGYSLKNSVTSLQKNIQSVQVVLEGESSRQSVPDVKGTSTFSSGIITSNWEDKRGMFNQDEDGYYCIKEKWKYSDEYYFLWNNSPLPLGKKIVIQLSAKENIKRENPQDKYGSIIIAYANPETLRPLYRMFFPASEKNLIGFDIDDKSAENTSPILPGSLRIPFDIYKSKFEIEYSVNLIEGNAVSFNYGLTFTPDDGLKKQNPESGFFVVPMSINPQNAKPFVVGIGVHRDGPCFKIESSPEPQAIGFK